MEETSDPSLEPVAGQRHSVSFDMLRSVVAQLAQLKTPGNAFLLPDYTMRYLISLVVIAGYLWMQWHSPQEGAVPQELVGIAGIVTGYALAGKGSPTMKAIVALVYVYSEVAFLVTFNWAPAAITGQVAIVIGSYFGRREEANG